MRHYIYSLTHPTAYQYTQNKKIKRAQKIGATTAPHARLRNHYTSHLHQPSYKYLLKINNKTCFEAEALIHKHFKNKRIDFEAGTEFFDEDITALQIKKFLETKGIYSEIISIEDVPADDSKDELKEETNKLLDLYEENNIKTKDEIIKLVTDTLTERTKKIILRDYQEIGINIFLTELLKYNFFKGVYYLATGLGKSVMMSAMCNEHIKKFPDDNILILTFRKDIVKSILKNFNKDNILCYVDHEFKIKEAQKAKGKIIFMLRQSLNKIIDNNIKINGLMYDESHDGCTIDSDTFVTLSKLTKLKYHIGFSATPLTDMTKQNKGVTEFYGKDGKINYLQSYGILKGIDNNWLCKFELRFMNIDFENGENKSFDDFFNSTTDDGDEHIKTNKQIYDKIGKNIKRGLDSSIFKKGIIWIPSVKCVKALYTYLKDKLGSIKVYKSYSGYNKHDADFGEAEKRCLMIACDKFTTGYDCKNLDVGFNFSTGEAGHKLWQKIGRFLRLKDGYEDESIKFYQLCDASKESKKNVMIGSFLKNMIGQSEDFDGNIHEQIRKLLDEKDKIDMEFTQFKVNFSESKYTYAEIKKDIEYHFVENKFLNIKLKILEENMRRKEKKQNRIETQQDYDEYAKLNMSPSVEELDCKLFDLLSLDKLEFKSWSSLKERCKKYNVKNTKDAIKVYGEIREKYQYEYPKDPSIYYKEYESMEKLFNQQSKSDIRGMRF